MSAINDMVSFSSLTLTLLDCIHSTLCSFAANMRSEIVPCFLHSCICRTFFTISVQQPLLGRLRVKSQISCHPPPRCLKNFFETFASRLQLNLFSILPASLMNSSILQITSVSCPANFRLSVAHPDYSNDKRLHSKDCS